MSRYHQDNIGIPTDSNTRDTQGMKGSDTSVRQEYEPTEEWHNYRTGSEITYGEQEMSIDIGKAEDNFDKDGKPKCFNCNIYRHIVKDCKKLKKK